MSSEHDFIRQRLARIERQLQQGPSDLVYESRSRGRQRSADDTGMREERLYKREARLLRHILAITKEGQVLYALVHWRRELGAHLDAHREQYRVQQDEYDTWWALPPYKRQRFPQPKRPPLAHYTDQNGQDWILDDRFLLLLEDLHSRLSQWMSEE